MNKPFQKMTAWVLAMGMVFSSFGGSRWLEAEAATEDEVEVLLVAADGSGNKGKTASIYQGESLPLDITSQTLKEPTPSDNIIVTRTENDGVQLTGDEIKLGRAPNGQYKYQLNIDPKAPSGKYTVNLDIMASAKNGIISQTTTGSGAYAGTFSFPAEDRVPSTSRLVLEYQGMDTNVWLPMFAIKEPGTGVFDSITRVAIGKLDISNVQPGETFNMEIRLGRGPESMDTTIQLLDLRRTGTQADPDNTQSGDLFEAGTKLELKFNPVKANGVEITVIDPQTMVDTIAKDLTTVPPYEEALILMEGDRVNSISADRLYLRYEGKEMATLKRDIEISWEWIPDGGDPGENKVIDIVPGMNGVPSTGEYAGFKMTMVNPLEKEVTGKLVPRVKFTHLGQEYTSDINKDNDKEQDYYIPITVLGKGDAPRVQTTTKNVEYDRKDDQNPTPDAPVDFAGDLPQALPMDPYKGNLPAKKVTKNPYRFDGHIFSGTEGKRAESIQIDLTGDADAIELGYDQGGESNIMSGASLRLEIQDGFGEERIPFYILAKEQDVKEVPKEVTVKFTFFRNGAPFREQSIKLTITDMGPNSYAYLAGEKEDEMDGLRLFSSTAEPDGNLWDKLVGAVTSLFGGDNWVEENEALQYAYDKFDYPTQATGRTEWIEFRYSKKQVKFELTKGDKNQRVDLKVTQSKLDAQGNPVTEPKKELSNVNGTIGPFPLEQDTGLTFEFTVTPPNQDMAQRKTYVVRIWRLNPSSQVWFDELQMATSEQDDAEIYSMVTETGEAFVPGSERDGGNSERTLEFQVNGPNEGKVPFKHKELFLNAKVNEDFGATITKVSSDAGDEVKEVPGAGWMVPLYSEIDVNGYLVDSKTTITIETKAEDGTVKTYHILVEKQQPSPIDTLLGLTVTDAAAEGEGVDLMPQAPDNFTANNFGPYEIAVEYSVEKVRFTPTFAQEGSTVELWRESDGKLLDLEDGVASDPVEVIAQPNDDPDFADKFVVKVTSENQQNQKEYRVYIKRKAPEDNRDLKNIQVFDGAGVEQKKDPPTFMPTITDYSVELDYIMDTAALLVTPGSETQTIYIDGDKWTPDMGQVTVNIPYPDGKVIKILVVAQNGDERTYTVTINRKAPDDNAWLKAPLIITNIQESVDNMLKDFEPKKLDYTATIVKDQNEVTITATAEKPTSKVLIRIKPDTEEEDELEKLVGTGELSTATMTVPIAQDKVTVQIIVTAQDGETYKVYTIVITNPALEEGSDNADLRSLKLRKGEMSPAFKAANTDYEFYVTEEESDVDIIPKAKDPKAKVQVFYGTKEIGDYDGNFSQMINDGENAFTITVTASQGEPTKDYHVTVYRNEEDKMGHLKPTTAEDLDFTQEDPIIRIDITKYPRVAADVFAELKKYPDKKVLLQGNDYSLLFDSKDLDTNIPVTMNYDFGLDFDSEFEYEIRRIMRSKSGNGDLRPLYIDFNYHGVLPGEAMFNISLGVKYADELLYLHYYNEERDRIEYWGSVITNSKGTFEVPVDKLGTLIVTRHHKIYGSEDRSDEYAGEQAINQSDRVTSKKVNPDTGTKKKWW